MWVECQQVFETFDIKILSGNRILIKIKFTYFHKHIYSHIHTITHTHTHAHRTYVRTYEGANQRLKNVDKKRRERKLKSKKIKSLLEKSLEKFSRRF